MKNTRITLAVLFFCFSKLWISHGKNASRSSSYRYVVYPGITQDKLDQLLRSEALPFMVNRSDVQLVRFGKSGDGVAEEKINNYPAKKNNPTNLYLYLHAYRYPFQ